MPDVMVTAVLALLAIFECGNSVDAPASNTVFYYGAATSAVQVEGCSEISCAGKGPSIWDEFTKVQGRIADNANASVADDSYHKQSLDLAMIDFMGLSAYRFSISWPRLLPKGRGPINEEGVQYYNSLIDALVERGVEPFVTLYHWDMPQALEAEYEGWLGTPNEIVRDFVSYAKLCFERFGDRVKKWITLNEPYTFVTLGYASGLHAPGRCSNRTRCKLGNSSTEPYRAAHNVILAHAAAVKEYRLHYYPQQGGSIGITLNQDWGEPFDMNKDEDIAAAERRNLFQKAWFADPIYFGHYPYQMVRRVGSRLPSFSPEEARLVKGSTDFLGLNHYSASYMQSCGARNSEQCTEDQDTVSTPFNASGHLVGPQAASAWLHVAPWAFYKMLMWNSKRYNNPLVYITENGVDVPGEGSMTYEQAWNDTFRVNYYRDYLSELERAMAAGLYVRGYFAWSLIDNFEWADAYSVRFGLCYVNYSNPVALQRLPKRSAAWYRDYITRAANHTTPEVLETDVFANVNIAANSWQAPWRSSYDSYWQYLINKLAGDIRRPVVVGGFM